VYIRLPESIPNSRLATLASPHPLSMLVGFPVRLTLDSLNRRSNIYRALIANPGAGIYLDEQHVYARNFEVPSGGGVGTARAIAHAYSVFATGGRELGVRKETLDAVKAPAVPPRDGFQDECLHVPWELSLGFQKPNALMPFGHPAAFGAPGWGGSFGFADPEVGLGYAYVMNRMRSGQGKEPRDEALRQALYRVIGKPRF
jgi:CubicO group peptidase (beta-lactamase class C family)